MVIYRDTIIDAVLDDELPDITNNYTLRVWIHDDGALQNYMQGQTFSAKVTVDGEAIEYTPESCFNFNKETGTIEDPGRDDNDNPLYDVETCGTDVVIPKTIDGVTVTTIGEGAFGGNESLTSVIIPNTVKDIKNGALASTTLSHITVPEGVITFNNFSDSFADIVTIYLPESLTDVSFSAFPYKTIVIPGSVKTISSVMELYTSGNIILMDGITEIEELALFVSGINEIEIPASVTTIGKNAFAENSYLTKIVLRGKTSVPDTFDENWNCKDEYECSVRYAVEFRP